MLIIFLCFKSHRKSINKANSFKILNDDIVNESQPFYDDIENVSPSNLLTGMIFVIFLVSFTQMNCAGLSTRRTQDHSIQISVIYL